MRWVATATIEMEREKCCERKKLLEIQSTTSSLKYGRGSAMAWACMVCMADSLVVTDDVTAHGSIRMNYEVYRSIAYAQIQPIASNHIGHLPLAVGQ